MKKYFLLALISGTILHAQQYHLSGRAGSPGFFSELHTLLGALHYYETSGDCTGLRVDYEYHNFFDPKHGKNYFEYFFEPINLTKQPLAAEQDAIRFIEYQKIIFSLHAQYNLSRERCFELIQRYIEPKQHIQNKVDTFCAEHFQDKYVIGVHYRGTDKSSEASSLTYEDMCAALEPDVREHANAVIFVATDEAPFLDYIRKRLGDKVVSIDMQRSSNAQPLHLNPLESMYAVGESAVLDCLLLSRCSKLFKMASNFSDAALKFNPSLPFIELNRNYSLNTESNKYDPLKTMQLALYLADQYGQTGQGFSMQLPAMGEKYPEGGNWWDYHFELLAVGDPAPPTKIPAYQKSIWQIQAQHEIPKCTAHRLLSANIVVKKEIAEEIATFAQNNFKNHVIGVYYSKATPSEIQPHIPYAWFVEYLKQRCAQVPNCTLLVSSDSKRFLYALQQTFDNVVAYSHPEDDSRSRIEQERETLTDCHLLAKADEVIGVDSTMLETVAQLNPHVPIKTFDTKWTKRRI